MSQRKRPTISEAEEMSNRKSFRFLVLSMAAPSKLRMPATLDTVATTSIFEEESGTGQELNNFDCAIDLQEFESDWSKFCS